MADTNSSDNLEYAFDVLDQLMKKVFANETRTLTGYKNPLLNPLRATFEQFSDSPTPANLDSFQQALQKCEAAENNKVNVDNSRLIIKASQEYMSFHPDNLSQNKQPDSTIKKKP